VGCNFLLKPPEMKPDLLNARRSTNWGNRKRREGVGKGRGTGDGGKKIISNFSVILQEGTPKRIHTWKGKSDEITPRGGASLRSAGFQNGSEKSKKTTTE